VAKGKARLAGLELFVLRVEAIVEDAARVSNRGPFSMRAAEAEALSSIRAELRALKDAGAHVGVPEPEPGDRFAAEVRRAMVELDARGRYGGLVPIPVLREWCEEKLRVTRDAFDERLKALAFKRSTIDLKVANDRSSVKRPELGVDIEGRGLAYWVVLRAGNR
jgi:hypothetical protein